MIELNENVKIDLINKLTKLLFNLRTQTLLIFLICFIIFLIIFAYILNTEDIAYIIFAIFFSFVTIFFAIYYYNIYWRINSKKIIIENISKMLKNNINIKYTPTLIPYNFSLLTDNLKYNLLKNKNPSFNLIHFINELILSNTDNLEQSISYLNRGFDLSFDFVLEDEIIIKSEDNLEIQIIELFLKEKYTKIEGTGKSRRTTIKYITNFEGLSISTKLNNPSIPTSQNPIIIYTSNLFKNPLNIKLRSYKQIIDSKDKQYHSINLSENTYCLYNINDENTFNNIKNILIKISDKVYNQRKYYNSLVIYYNNLLYLFINHKDGVFNSKNILEPPFYLLTSINNVEKIINNFKNQLEKILKLVL